MGYTVINTHKLDCLPNQKVYFGQFEVALLLKEALQNSATPSSKTRLNRIQTCCQIITTFYTSTHPSTMAPGDTKLAAKYKVLTCPSDGWSH